MSGEQAQTFEETVNAFYPDAEAEPLEAPTAEVETDETPEEAEGEEAEIVEESEADTEESESSDEEADEVEDVQAIEIDGVEHNLTDIQEWKEAHDNVKLMQADCTKKWQEAADLKKDAETQSEKAQGLVLELEALVAEDKDLDLESYRDIESDNYDPDRYIELKDKFDKRAAKLTELKASQPSPQQVLTGDELAAESKDFYDYNPKWIKDGELTPVFQEEMTAAGVYLKDAGYSQDEVNAIQYSHHWKTIVDASKYQALTAKKTAVKKKLIKTPKVTKPKANSTTLSAEETFYGKN